MHRLLSRSARASIWGTLVCSLAFCSAASSLQTHPQRKSTDPPAAASGKYGQDLFLALDHRDLPHLKSLLKRGADPNSYNGLGFAPLFIAAASHQLEAMQALLAAGAKANDETAYGTPLLFAASSANMPGVGLLMGKKPDVNATRTDGMTVLMFAAATGDPEVVKTLLIHKATVNTKDDDGATALFYAARTGNPVVGQMLVNAGAKLNLIDAYHQTPLMIAAQTGQAGFAKFLLSRGANPNVRDDKGRTALILASEYGDYPQIVRALIGAKANIGQLDSSGCSAAALAKARGHVGSSEILGEPTASCLKAANLNRTVSSAVKVSLKAIQASMSNFDQATTCVSCHHDGLGRVALATVRNHGFQIDPKIHKLEMMRVGGMVQFMEPMHEKALKDPEAMKQLPLIEINEVNVINSWILFGMAAQNEPPTAGSAAMAMVLAKQQLPDGHWSFSGPREPMESSFLTITALSVKGLEVYGPKSHHAELSDRISKAKSWLLQAPTVNSEDRASKLLGLVWTACDAADVERARDAVVADQRPDGGWAQLPNLQSDAYATGQALYALHVGGVPTSDPTYQKGVDYLLRTQDRDGSWFVNKRAAFRNNHFDAGFPHGKSLFSSFNGTCWAAMALAETVTPESPSQHLQTRR